MRDISAPLGLSDDYLIQGKGRVDPTPNWRKYAIYFVDDKPSSFTYVPGNGHLISTSSNYPNYYLRLI
jgi:hypothetical protein